MIPATVPAFEKRFTWAGHAFFLVFIALAALLYRERVMVADCAFQFFSLLRTKEFAIYHNRFSPFIAQLLPLAGVYAKLPLNAVLVLYSVSVPLVCYGYYWLAAHVLKDYRAAVAMALAACIVLTEGFYFAPFELNQAVSLLIFLFAFLLHQNTFRWWHWALVLAGILLALFFHPLVIIGFLFVMGYGFLRQPKQNFRQTILLVGFGIGLLVAKTLFFTDAYDSGKFSLVNAIRLVPHFFTLPMVQSFAGWLVRDYYMVLILAGLLTWQYSRSKQWLLLAYFWLALVGYIVLVMLTYADGTPNLKYYFESHYQLIALIVALPFAYDVLPVFRQVKLLPLLLLLVLSVRLVSIYFSKAIFTERLNWYDKLYSYTSQFPENRFIINEKNLAALTNQNKLTWASGYESLLYFTSTHKNPIKTFFITDKPQEFGYLQYEKNKFAAAFEVLDMADLPAHYFNLAPSGYRFLNTQPENNADSLKIKIRPVNKTVYASTSQPFTQIPVTINSALFIGADLNVPEPYMLSYQLFKGNQEIASLTFKTPLEIDIKGDFEQNILVETPKEQGTYYIIPVILPHTGSSWEEAAEIKLIVK